jgi:hypothetical protein
VSLPDTMRAMVTTGHGGFDKLSYRTDWPRPDPGPGEVLIRVGACGLNNTDINTREGWYSKAVTGATGSTGEAPDGEDPSWGGAPIVFPRIQGADACGRIVAVGVGVDPARIGERVITDNWLRDPDDLSDKTKTGYFGSECDGGFAEYATMPARNALAVNSPLSDAELATFSCSYSTAEGMLTRARVTAEDRRAGIDQAERGGGEIETDDGRQQHAARHRHREGRPEPATRQDQGQEPTDRRDRRRHDMARAVHHDTRHRLRIPGRRFGVFLKRRHDDERCVDRHSDGSDQADDRIDPEREVEDGQRQHRQARRQTADHQRDPASRKERKVITTTAMDSVTIRPSGASRLLSVEDRASLSPPISRR